MVSVVVIGYNQARYVSDCLESVLRQDAPISEVFYIDCASTDESCAKAERYAPRVRTIAAETNWGYARAANYGACEATGEFVLILNTDVILHDDYCTRCIDAMSSNARCAGVTGKIYKYDYSRKEPTQTIDTVGLVALAGRQFLDRGAGTIDEGQYDTPCEVFGLSGNCPFFRREALSESAIMGEIFDEEFFMYKEDVDLCWRLRLLGWTFLYTPDAVGYHERGTGVVNRSTWLGMARGRLGLRPFQRYYSYRNHRLMLIKNELRSTFGRDFVAIAKREVCSFLWILLLEPRTLSAVFSLVHRVPSAYRKRKAIMQRRKRSDGDELGLFVESADRER